MIIAIDGPSGAGKGTVARAVARHLGFRHVDTGAMYRATAWLAVTKGIQLDDEPSIEALARAAVFDLDGGRVVIDGHDVTTAIRTPELDRAATAVARLPRVRAVLVAHQRRMGEGGGVVMEGRDIGTVVFPSADVKIYLDASPEERARRRAHDPAHTVGTADVEAVAGALAERDRLDRTRSASPLTVAADAALIDTTDLTVDEVVVQALDVIERSRYERPRSR